VAKYGNVMGERALVSVIIPFFETPPALLLEAVESVVAQSYAAWELILVDDGSRGPCREVAARAVARYGERVRLAAHPGRQNLGHSATRNLGLDVARGQYVAFLDSDDVYRPDKLEVQVALLERFPAAGMVFGRSLYWRSWNGGGNDQAPGIGVEADMLLHPPGPLPLFLRGTVAVPPPCGIVARTEAVRAVGGFEVEFRKLYEDQVFIAKMCLSYPVVADSGVRDAYRQRSDSLSGSASVAEDSEARRRFLAWLAAYLKAQQRCYRAVDAAIRSESRKLDHPHLARLWRMGQKLLLRVPGT
jgi:glycosyltransferase involved in cell wall biosynthesis